MVYNLGIIKKFSLLCTLSNLHLTKDLDHFSWPNRLDNIPYFVKFGNAVVILYFAESI